MEQQVISVAGLPGLAWGKKQPDALLCVHGRYGCKEQFTYLAQLAQDKGFQLVSFDLPGHGARSSLLPDFTPWRAKEELLCAAGWVKERYQKVALYAESIGAYFSLLAFENVPFQKALFVSPVLEMQYLIEGMMASAHVTAEELEKRRHIPTDSGEILSWQYYTYVREHSIDTFVTPASVLYAEKDNMTTRQAVTAACGRFGWKMTVMENGEHYFHTPEQLAFLQKWMKENL